MAFPTDFTRWVQKYSTLINFCLYFHNEKMKIYFQDYMTDFFIEYEKYFDKNGEPKIILNRETNPEQKQQLKKQQLMDKYVVYRNNS